MKKGEKIVSFFKKDIKLTILFLVFIIVALAMLQICGTRFYSANNLQSIAFQIPEFALLAFAMMLCMITGGIDLSVVSISGLSSILAAIVMNHIMEGSGNEAAAIAAAVVTALVSATLCGFINGILISQLHILPILVTLSTMILYSGLATGITGGSGITGYPASFLLFGKATIAKIPVVFVLVVVIAIVICFVLDRTRYGKILYFYGENSVVSLFSAINNGKALILTYTVSGFLCGLSGIIMMARNNSAKVGYGDTYQLQAILVCAIGGIDPNGGSGRAVGVCIAIILLQILQSGFNVLGYDPYLKRLVWGCVLIGVMIMNCFLFRRKKGK